MAPTNLTQPAFSSGIISSELFSRIDFDKIRSGLKQCENFVVRPAGGAIYRVGTKFINHTKNNEVDVALIPFIYNRKDGLCLAFGEQYIEVYDNGVKIHEMVSPYHATEVFQIKFAQNKNDMYLVHPNHPPAVLTRNSNTDFTYRELKFNPSVPTTTISIASGDYVSNEDAYTKLKWDNWRYAVSVVDKDDNESLATYSNIISNDIDLTHQPIKITVNKLEDETNIDHYNIYKIKGGEYYLVYSADVKGENISITDVGWQIDTNVSVKERFDEFSEGNYPSAVAMWNQRLILGNTQKKPNTFWGSRVKQYEDFTNTIVNAADEGFELTFNSGTLDAITDFVPLDDLIVFTEGKIWRVSGTSVQNMSAFIESYSGASGLKPFATKKSVLYVDSSQNTVSNFIYSDELNGYTGQELDILARDLLDGYFIKDISYRDTPYGVLYAVRNDGVLLGLTYMREEGIYAWHKHTTKDGKFKSICSIDKNNADQVYCIVERNGVGHVEMFGGYIDSEQDINDSWHLDCASKYISEVYSYQNQKQIVDEYEEKVFEATNSGVYTFTAARDGWYDITLVGGGGGGSTSIGGGGAGLIISANLLAGEYTISIGKGGKGANPYVRNNNGYDGEDSSFYNKDLSFVCKGGTKGYARRQGGAKGKRGVVTISSFRDYNILSKTTDNEQVNTSFITGDTSGYGAGAVKQTNDEGRGFDGVSGYCKIIMHGEKYHYEDGDYLYTKGEPTIGCEAFYNIDLPSYELIDGLGDDYIIVNNDKYFLKSKSANVYDKVTGLERFNGQTVSAVIDTNCYDNLYVENGEVYLPYTASNVLIGLPYDGVLETIPFDITVSGESTTVGMPRRVFDGTLSYYRSRGLWYGRDKDHMYEIKPYTNENYSLNIPLESGKINLKVADGYSLESSFVVMQKAPLPALVQSITLGVSYNGKV